jgi:hypothetical protein
MLNNVEVAFGLSWSFIVHVRRIGKSFIIEQHDF